ncbi:hypothetical protein [Rhizobium sp. LjRoot254]|uniref:hypothetical protein n=1 Tax=Rhizobium sp. LjRoot254 TaxID=3342297 RepID=UPI003ECF80EB
MRTAFRIALALLAMQAIPTVAGAATKNEVLYQTSLDIDRDGKPDKALLVLAGPGRTDFHELTRDRYGLSENERVDLYIYLGKGGENADLRQKPDFVKQQIADPERVPWVQPLEVSKSGSLLISAAHQWGASHDWTEILTVIYRNGEPVVAGFTMGWSWNSLLADDTFETLEGECDVNFLTGKGTLTKDADKPQPIKAVFKPVKLTDWTSANIPKACDWWQSQDDD